MFGTITVNPRQLTKDEKLRYRALYCGLCLALKERFGRAGQATLSYDMTFVAALLGSLYELPEEHARCRCAAHPLRAQASVRSKATAYAADMNLYLAYYKDLDDWNDDKSQAALRRSQQLAPYLPGIRERWPRQCGMVDSSLAAIGEMERRNVLNPDLPAGRFGELMGEVLVWREDAHSPALRSMGGALGRFIYLLDAVNDLRSDIRHLRYNPLVAQTDTDFLPALTLLMDDCTGAFETLGLARDLHLLRNVLYSGVWTRCRLAPAGGTHDSVPPDNTI